MSLPLPLPALNDTNLPSGDTSTLKAPANIFTIWVGVPPSIDTIHGDCTPLRLDRKMTD
jgi:hypothetical protein